MDQAGIGMEGPVFLIFQGFLKEAEIFHGYLVVLFSLQKQAGKGNLARRIQDII